MDFDFNEPLFYKLEKNNENLVFRLKKGKLKNIPLIDNEEELKKLEESYTTAKKLKPIEGIPIPYTNIYKILYGSYLLSSTNDFDYFNLNPRFMEQGKLLIGKEREKVVLYNSITGIKPFIDHEFFRKYISSNKSYESLFIFNTLTISTLEEYLVYREKNSKKSYQDNTYAIELPFYITSERKETDPEKREKFKKIFKKVNYNLFLENICNYDNMLRLLNETPDNLNFINITCSMFLWKIKKYNSYMNSQLTLSLIFLSLKKLRRGGILKIQFRELDNQITYDLISVLQYFFSDVIIYKSSIDNLTTPWKFLICTNFNGKDEIIFNKIEKIIIKWNRINKNCQVDIKSYDLERDDYLVSFLEKNNIRKSIQEFNNVEIKRKLIVYNDIITTYYSLKFLDREKILERIYEKNLAKTLYFLRKNNIDEKIPYKANDKKILVDDFSIDFNEKDIFTSISLRDDNNMSIELEQGDYETDELTNLDNDLKFTKRLLDTLYYKLYKEISSVRKRLDGLKNYIDKEIDVSQAFLKLSEILEKFQLIDKKSKELRAFHFCEAPGQFILATQNYIENKTKIENYDWIAQSLNPYQKNKKHRGVFGDDYGLIRKYKNRWDFGKDNSGDITKSKNIRYYKDIVSRSQLITSDCGLDMSDPTDAVYQDKNLSYVNFCQILLVLNGIQEGSHYVSKIFLPQTHPFVIGMNYILSKCFEDVFIHKSLINSGSSEVYMVCKNFIHIENEIVEKLFEIKNKFSFSKIFIKIPKLFLDNYTSVLRIYILRHIEHIKTNIYYYNYPEGIIELSKSIETIKKRNVKNWIKHYKFK